jgi:enoyl-CoA hydratase
VRLQKKLIRDWENMTLDQAVRAGIESFKQAYATDEPARMMGTFVNRARQKKG